MIDWDKGKAVEFLLQSLGLSDCENVIPIYIGDDRTDEDAFKVTISFSGSCAVHSHLSAHGLLLRCFDQVLRERNCGYGILVSQVPKETEAFYSLRDPSEVKLFVVFFLSLLLPVLFSEWIPDRLLLVQVMEFLNSLVRWKKHSL